MRKIGFVSNHYHSEVIEFLLELYNTEDTVLVWYYDIDWYSNNVKYKNRYGDKLIIKKVNEIEKDIEKVEYELFYFAEFFTIINIEKLPERYIDKIVIIAHTEQHVEKLEPTKFKYITLTPLLSQNYMIPVTRDSGDSKIVEKRKANGEQLNICSVGYFDHLSRDKKILSGLLENNVHLHVFARYATSDLINFYFNHKEKMTLHLNYSTEKILEKIDALNIELVTFCPSKNSKHLTTIYTGSINFAYNNNIPMLTTPEFAKIYNLTGHVEVKIENAKIDMTDILNFMNHPEKYSEKLLEYKKNNFDRNKIMKDIVEYSVKNEDVVDKQQIEKALNHIDRNSSIIVIGLKRWETTILPLLLKVKLESNCNICYYFFDEDLSLCKRVKETLIQYGNIDFKIFNNMISNINRMSEGDNDTDTIDINYFIETTPEIQHGIIYINTNLSERLLLNEKNKDKFTIIYPSVKIIWINMEASRDRREFMEKQFKTLRYYNERFSAITPEILPKILDDPQKRISDKEYACLCSHLFALKSCLSYKDEWFCIMEDDMEINREADLCELIASAPQDAEILQLFTNHSDKIQELHKMYIQHQQKWAKWTLHTHSAGMYLINKKAIHKILNTVIINDSIDLTKINTDYMADYLIYSLCNTYVSTYPIAISLINLGSTLHPDHLYYHNLAVKKIHENIIGITYGDWISVKKTPSQKLCGLLIEPRFLTNIPTLIDNFFSVLPNVPLFFYCGKSVYPFFKRYYEKNKNIILIALETDNLTADEYSDICKSRKFWEKLSDFEYTLTIQTDGCLCKNSKFKIEDFYKYDFVGGYAHYKWFWKETKGLHDINDYQCFNGGFSLRRNAAMIDVIDKYPPGPSEKFNENLPFENYAEDLYFVVGLLKINKAINQKKYNVGLDEFSTSFCSHTCYIKDTFCVHKLDEWANSENWLNIFDYCPEFLPFVNTNKLMKKFRK